MKLIANAKNVAVKSWSARILAAVAALGGVEAIRQVVLGLQPLIPPEKYVVVTGVLGVVGYVARLVQQAQITEEKPDE